MAEFKEVESPGGMRLTYMVPRADEPQHILDLQEAFAMASACLMDCEDVVRIPRSALCKLMDVAGGSLTFAAAAERAKSRS